MREPEDILQMGGRFSNNAVRCYDVVESHWRKHMSKNKLIGVSRKTEDQGSRFWNHPQAPKAAADE
jgi:hypothetical protein